MGTSFVDAEGMKGSYPSAQTAARGLFLRFLAQLRLASLGLRAGKRRSRGPSPLSQVDRTAGREALDPALVREELLRYQGRSSWSDFQR